MSLINYPGQPGVKNFPGFSSYTLKIIRKTVALTSPFTGRRQAVAYPFAHWSFSGKYSTADLTGASTLRAFFTQLQGMANKFQLPVPDFVPNAYVVGINDPGFVDGANQTGNSLVTTWPSLNTAVMYPGDYFSVNGELKVCRDVVITDGSGLATITFDPPLKTSPLSLTQLQMGGANLIGWSLNPSVTTWNGKNIWQYVNGTIIATAVTPPGGGTLNTNQISSMAAGAVEIFQDKFLGNLSNRTFTYSIYLQQGNIGPSVQVGLQASVDSILPTYLTVATTTVILNSSWQRLTVTYTMPAAELYNSFRIFIVYTATGASQTVNIYGAQLEEASAATFLRNSSDGSGPPVATLALNADDGATWDLSPPMLYQFSLDAEEVFE